jgi:hypothetical protein
MSRGRRPGIRKTIGAWSWNSTILWSKIVETDADSCWAWLGSRGPQTNLFGVRHNDQAQMTQARRILYRDVFNEDCDDKQIKHTCGNAYCMNWQHFELRPNQHMYRLDGTDRHTPKPEKPQTYIPRAKMMEVSANRRWWNE